MSHDDLKNYFTYVKNTLGVNQLYTEKEDNNAATKVNSFLTQENAFDSHRKNAPKTQVWHIFVESFSDYTQSEKELLGKMLDAVHLHLNDYEIKSIDLKQLEAFKANPEHFFSANGMKSFLFVDNPQNYEFSRRAVTYSPRILMQSTQLKRAAWEIMKQAFRPEARL